nr:MAG TPA: hypothetical protein [Caudoviricetes sp.]
MICQNLTIWLNQNVWLPLFRFFIKLTQRRMRGSA